MSAAFLLRYWSRRFYQSRQGSAQRTIDQHVQFLRRRKPPHWLPICLRAVAPPGLGLALRRRRWTRGLRCAACADGGELGMLPAVSRGGLGVWGEWPDWRFNAQSERDGFQR
jgi:hypothetical protein